MNKRILTMAIAAATLSTAASAASPDFYGAMRFAVSNADTGYAANGGGGAGFTLQDDNSLVGVRGKIELDAPFQLVYQAEVGVQGVDSTNTQKPFYARDTFLGIAGNFGQLTFGRQALAIWKSEGGVDQFNLTNADMNRLFTGNNRVADMINYVSPKIAGATVYASYQLKDDVYGKDAEVPGDLYSIGAVYGDKSLKDKPYHIGLGYNAGVNNVEALRITGQVAVAKLKLGAVYQNSKSLVNTNLDGSGFMLDAAYPITPKLSLKARYGQDDSGQGVYMGRILGDGNLGIDKSQVNATKVVNMAIGADYKLSKTTKLYTHFSRYDAQVDVASARVYDATDNVFNLGLMTKF
ncbi:porin [Paraferrimonas sedimenticola]|uniref:Porin domain-containing protein n=1 Tax=Paraferrimonas sedimenticola TaxID=375674 RepID=A0AA37W060_9GAMM|nr:porin [Paraferrimonas sedimenticola]GLP95023.1 hypothetical protein GCM10007895_03290 [Paraferrimonas sedimenticola]